MQENTTHVEIVGVAVAALGFILGFSVVVSVVGDWLGLFLHAAISVGLAVLQKGLLRS